MLADFLKAIPGKPLWPMIYTPEDKNTNVWSSSLYTLFFKALRDFWAVGVVKIMTLLIACDEPPVRGILVRVA